MLRCTAARIRGGPQVPGTTGAYRDIRANMEQTSNPEGLDHYRKVLPLRRTRGSGCEEECCRNSARANDTVRNHCCPDDHRQRGTEAAASPCEMEHGVPAVYRGRTCPAAVREWGLKDLDTHCGVCAVPELRARALTWGSKLGARAHSPHLSPHGPGVWLAGTAGADRRRNGYGDRYGDANHGHLRPRGP